MRQIDAESFNAALRNKNGENAIGHFRGPKSLTFKMRLGAQPFL